jgi:hypothetical protein
MRRNRQLVAALLLLWASGAWAEALSMGVRGYLVQQEVFSLFAEPGEEIRLELASYDTDKLQLQLDGQAYGVAGEGYWVLTAPERAGLYQLQLEHGETHARSQVNLFIGHSVPAGEEELNGYRTGPPPPGHNKYPDFYPQPQLYFEVTADNVDTRLSEHFTLRQFLCKQESDYPKYVILKESLLVLLEGLVQAVQQAGYPVDTFGVISGYRTPYYNKRIGNVPNSRHVYGDAMDLFVDMDEDGKMDDLNGDGQNNRADVDLLYKIVESFKQQPGNRLLVGGVGRYYKASHHGGFVHMDARGFRARW